MTYQSNSKKMAICYQESIDLQEKIQKDKTLLFQKYDTKMKDLQRQLSTEKQLRMDMIRDHKDNDIENNIQNMRQQFYSQEHIAKLLKSETIELRQKLNVLQNELTKYTEIVNQKEKQLVFLQCNFNMDIQKLVCETNEVSSLVEQYMKKYAYLYKINLELYEKCKEYEQLLIEKNESLDSLMAKNNTFNGDIKSLNVKVHELISFGQEVRKYMFLLNEICDQNRFTICNQKNKIKLNEKQWKDEKDNLISRLTNTENNLTLEMIEYNDLTKKIFSLEFKVEHLTENCKIEK